MFQKVNYERISIIVNKKIKWRNAKVSGHYPPGESLDDAQRFDSPLCHRQEVCNAECVIHTQQDSAIYRTPVMCGIWLVSPLFFTVCLQSYLRAKVTIFFIFTQREKLHA